jgi:hypothetical protein
VCIQLRSKTERRNTVMRKLLLSLLLVVFLISAADHTVLKATEGILGRSVLDWPIGVTVYKPEKCYNGYTVVAPYRAGVIFLIDMAGRVVHTWKSGPSTTAEGWFLELLPNGNWITLNLISTFLSDIQDPEISLKDRMFHAISTEVVEMNWEGKTVWKYTAPEGWTIHHDMARLENGNTIMLVEESKKVPEISEKEIAENFIIEVTQEKEIVWQWYATEHFSEFGFSSEAGKAMSEIGGDIFHHNTLEVLPPNALEEDPRFVRGNLLSCQRSTGLIYIIDRKTEKVVWTWGTGTDELVGPHHPTMLDNGNILIYDNGGRHDYPVRTRFFSRLIEINPKTKEIVWQYMHEPHIFKETSKFFSRSWGSVQRLPNGNTFSLDCHKGRLFEVTPGGEIVWEYISPFAWGRGTKVVDSGIYRAYRYSYKDVPQADSYFSDTDGHADVEPAVIKIPDGMGLPPE